MSYVWRLQYLFDVSFFTVTYIFTKNIVKKWNQTSLKVLNNCVLYRLLVNECSFYLWKKSPNEKTFYINVLLINRCFMKSLEFYEIILNESFWSIFCDLHSYISNFFRKKQESDIQVIKIPVWNGSKREKTTQPNVNKLVNNLKGAIKNYLLPSQKKSQIRYQEEMLLYAILLNEITHESNKLAIH